MKMVQEEIIRKGPWTAQEDLKLVSYVALFGDKRWDFIAKVSGLNRSGKSCRLRWVNYLHPGLKRGKLTTQEERLVFELHSIWGNRWSRIARKLPGRTDNEIKNYWRTHMRKKAQDQKKHASSLKSESSNCLSSSSISNQMVEYFPSSEAGAESYFDTGGVLTVKATADKKKDKAKELEGGDQLEYSLDDIWKDIALPDNDFLPTVFEGHSEEGCNFSCPPMASPSWEYEYSSEPLAVPNTPSYDQFASCFAFGDYI